MSSIPRRSGPSRHYDIDYSSRETSIGRYTNNAIHVSDPRTLHLQVIQNHASANDRDNLLEPLHKLRKHCSLNATFDAGARFDPPRCAETTRIEIIQRIEQWINHPGSNKVPASLFWLYGGAGVGKSALAQTLSEKFQQEQKLGATFFFFRNEVSRNNGNTLIPTLVWQLVHTFNGLGPFVEQRIHANPDLFTKQHQTQIRELLVEPLLLKSRKELLPRLLGLSEDTPEFRPWLIVVDGLDECKDQEIQCKLLLAIADAIPRIPHPLRFLVTSRPEPHIVRMFNHDRALQAITADRYNLSDDPDADMDIRKFLEEEFGEICRSHCLSRHLPPGWPDKRSIGLLVERSSGHFIYAVTVIRYIRSERHRPDDRLEIILRLLPPEGHEEPYTQLDALYSLVFQGVESHDELEKICLVLGIIYVATHTGMGTEASYSQCSTIERILGMKAGDVILLLSPILSLVAIENEEVRILHKSLFDYLLDPTRSGCLLIPFDPTRVHELAAMYILRERILAGHCTIFEFANFAYHCRFGYLNDTLKDYLHDVDVPYPKRLKTMPNTPLKMRVWNRSLQLVMTNFFRVLSRDDFDSTGLYHEQYAAKWMSYLLSVNSRHDQLQRTSGLLMQKVDSHGVKDRFDTMLKRWKPKTFKSTKVEGKIPVIHVGIIEKEHHVWSTLARASASIANSNAVSSLVFNDDFIYSYHFTTKQWLDNSHFLKLLIYARHEDAYDDNSVTGYSNIFGAMQYCLERAEKFLLSELSQKYGIFPEGTSVMYANL